MRIWFQLVSSPRRSPNFLKALQAHCDQLAAPGTEVLVRGTPNGGFADQFEALLHLDGAEILRLAHEDVDGTIDVYAMGNCMDPAVSGLRELLDVPVITLMEAGCFTASLLGERFGVIAPNTKMIPIIRDVVTDYGYRDRLAGLVSLDFTRITDMDALFTDPDLAAEMITEIKRLGTTLVKQGAEVLLAPGPIAALVAREGLTSIAGAPLLDLFGTLLKFAEGLGALREGGLATSRLGRYRSPAKEDVVTAMQTIWP